ncbi:MAG TPA: nuclear transport factor 2 family protein [Acidimicrobiales bacterium]|nr:nuclear transport factor 2 family protein [Acidimicrobiales bacterium]
MPTQESASMRELRDFVDRCHAAITQQSQGHPEPFLELWSHADDVTIMAAIGGYQVGFEAVCDLLTAASKTQQFDGWRAENLATVLDDGLAFTVELEYYSHTVDGEDKGMTLRATQIYRQEDGDWRVIHRHGDVLTPIEARW